MLKNKMFKITLKFKFINIKFKLSKASNLKTFLLRNNNNNSLINFNIVFMLKESPIQY